MKKLFDPDSPILRFLTQAAELAWLNILWVVCSLPVFTLGASTAAEDERDLSKVEMSLERFRVFTRGYVRACPNLTARELELLPLGAKTITLECGMRFLTDHIDGDLYFAVHREGQNLDRARAQFRLAADIEKKWDDMQRIVAEETKA
jgi:hypothetical protein